MFYENLKKICKKNGTTVTEILKKLGMSSGNTGRWKNGGVPSMEVAQKIAKELDVSIDSLMRDEDAPQTERDELNEYLEEIRTRPEMKMLFSLTKNASKEDVEKAVKVIEAMLEN